MPNANDQYLSREIRARVDITYYGNKIVRDVIELLEAADRDLQQQILRRVESRSPAYWTTARLQAILDEVRDTLSDTYERARLLVEEEATAFATFEAGRVKGNLEQYVGVHFSITSVTAAKLAAIVSDTPIAVGPEGKLLLEEIFASLAASKEKTIRQAIRMGMVEGEPIRNITNRLFSEDGLLVKDARGAEAMVRTVVNHTSNETAQAVYESNTDVVKGVMWVSVLDNRTTIICQSRDGKIYPVNSGPRPPAHVNCRSIVVPILKSWEEMGISAKEITDAQRASLTGQVPAKMTYPEWLRANPQYAEEVLGKVRADAFLAGKVEISQFVNNQGRVLTLEELRDRHIL
jgi:SPP1 gp7 family putative phage head morphogenesis protein